VAYQGSCRDRQARTGPRAGAVGNVAGGASRAGNVCTGGPGTFPQVPPVKGAARVLISRDGMVHVHSSVQVLIAGADDACRRGDLSALSSLVRSLVPRIPHALQYDAVAVAELAALDGALACQRWQRLAAALGGAPEPSSDRAAA
jgi:hypothetical protein